jgi:cell division protein FtsQ
MTRNKLKYIGSNILWFLFLAFLGFSFIVNSGTFNRREIGKIQYKVLPLKEGEVLITEDEIEKMFNNFIKVRENSTKIGDVPLNEVREYFINEPLIKRADVYIDIHQNLHIDIVQRVPFLRILTHGGKSFLMDQEGFAFPVSKNYSPRLLVVTGFLPGYQEGLSLAEHNQYKEVIEISQIIHEDEFWKSTIEQIHIDEFGEFVLVPKIGARKIEFGGQSNAREKLEKLKIFYREVLPELGWDTYHSLNIKFNKQVIGIKNN